MPPASVLTRNLPDGVSVRPALPSDVRRIRDLVEPYANERILVAKEQVAYYEAVQEFLVAAVVESSEDGATDDALADLPDDAKPGDVVGCGALHVMWDDLAEVRTLAVDPSWVGRGVGHAILETLLDRARALGLSRLFCLTFEVDFFASHGFEVIQGTPVEPDVYAQLLRSHDDGIAEFLDLARVKPNTLGNTRMLLNL